MEKIPVALLGLGTMGTGMAANLLKAGFPLTVYNRTIAKAEPFAAQGARIAKTPADAAKSAKLILSMLSDDDASREAWPGVSGALAAAEPGAVLVESSTASPPGSPNSPISQNPAASNSSTPPSPAAAPRPKAASLSSSSAAPSKLSPVSLPHYRP